MSGADTADPRLSPELRSLVRVSAAIGLGAPGVLDEALAGSRRNADPDRVEEVLVQSYLFVGFPRALAALARWRNLSDRDPPAAHEDDCRTRGDRGEACCRRVYGEQYSALRRNIAHLHPDMDRWMVEEGYGKVLARDGLPLGERELCIAALLAALPAPVQLYSHLRGALEVGVDRERVGAMVATVATMLPRESREEFESAWEEIRERRRDRGFRPGTEQGE